MSTDITWLIGGPQGSGVETGANIFSRVCAEMGYQVFGKREFYSNIKGEHSYFAVRVADKKIHSNLNDVTVMVSFDAETIFRLSRKIESMTHSKFVSLNQLLKKSDVISVHVPYTKQTRQLVDMKFLKKMKKSSFFINTARGGIIKEKDLISALKRGTIAGAALDVFENEPIGKNHPFVKMDNVVIAPHIGSSTLETRRKMAELTVKNLELALSGKKPIYSV